MTRLLALILLLASQAAIWQPQASGAEARIDTLKSLCSGAAPLSRGAAAFGCDLLLNDPAAVVDAFPDGDEFVEMGCAQAAPQAAFEQCSLGADAVRFGYRLRCQAVMEECGCDGPACMSPGAQRFAGYPVHESGSSCSYPREVSIPPKLVRSVADAVVGLLFRRSNRLSDILESVADPSGRLYEDRMAAEMLIRELARIPDRTFIVVRGDDYVSMCYQKLDLGQGQFKLESGA